MMLTRLSSRAALAVVLTAGLGLAAGFAMGRSSVAAQNADLGTWVSTGGTEIELLLSESNLGGSEIQIGEITWPPGANSGSHPHGATEIFYVLEGELEHVVDGVSEILGPGDLGFVRPPSEVNHITSPDGGRVRALVIWAPGGEGTRIVGNWQRIE
ncbi:MAG: cupin domain-containing protein [Acidobacteria bacterium]|nr:cupin domain-containing protein [Acidobacteriota bacterium]